MDLAILRFALIINTKTASAYIFPGSFYANQEWRYQNLIMARFAKRSGIKEIPKSRNQKSQNGLLVFYKRADH
jgi:hypothetical protein